VRQYERFLTNVLIALSAFHIVLFYNCIDILLLTTSPLSLSLSLSTSKYVYIHIKHGEIHGSREMEKMLSYVNLDDNDCVDFSAFNRLNTICMSPHDTQANPPTPYHKNRKRNVVCCSLTGALFNMWGLKCLCVCV
jgi:hypothetical protein